MVPIGDAPDCPIWSARVAAESYSSRCAREPVVHPAQRAPLLDEARPAVVVTTPPSPHPLSLERPFLELEGSSRRFFVHVHG